jgi:hypothetical protein
MGVYDCLLLIIVPKGDLRAKCPMSHAHGSGGGAYPTIRSLDCVACTCCLPILLAACRNGSHWCAWAAELSVFVRPKSGQRGLTTSMRTTGASQG